MLVRYLFKNQVKNMTRVRHNSTTVWRPSVQGLFHF